MRQQTRRSFILATMPLVPLAALGMSDFGVQLQVAGIAEVIESNPYLAMTFSSMFTFIVCYTTLNMPRNTLKTFRGVELNVLSTKEIKSGEPRECNLCEAKIEKEMERLTSVISIKFKHGILSKDKRKRRELNVCPVCIHEYNEKVGKEQISKWKNEIVAGLL